LLYILSYFKYHVTLSFLCAVRQIVRTAVLLVTNSTGNGSPVTYQADTLWRMYKYTSALTQPRR